MQAALALMRGIDTVNDRVGRLIYWLILVTVLISSANAISRYGFNVSSNAWLEIQWYLFSAIFLLGAGYAMLKNAHVRIDLVSSRFSNKTNAWVDVVGFVVFVIPMCLVFISFGWDMFWTSWIGNETSTDAGGLIRWPVKILVPIGFVLLLAQAISELIKRIGFLRGVYDWSPHGSTPADDEPQASTPS
jgi:TRAP-type mannitol/chloroaromatic compound transport system permease small subunit